MSNKFQTTLTEVTALIEQNKEKNLKLREENCEIAERFANVYKQYEQRDQVNIKYNYIYMLVNIGLVNSYY